MRSLPSVGFREQAIEQAAEEKFLKEQILALEPYVRAHADRFSKEDLAEYSAHLERYGADPVAPAA